MIANNYHALRRIAAVVDETLSRTEYNPTKALEEIRMIALVSIRESEQPANTVEAPAVQHILSRDQRDALCAANVLLAQIQNDADGLYRQRLQKIMNVISDMLYG